MGPVCVGNSLPGPHLRAACPHIDTHSLSPGSLLSLLAAAAADEECNPVTVGGTGGFDGKGERASPVLPSVVWRAREGTRVCVCVCVCGTRLCLADVMSARSRRLHPIPAPVPRAGGWSDTQDFQCGVNCLLPTRVRHRTPHFLPACLPRPCCSALCLPLRPLLLCCPLLLRERRGGGQTRRWGRGETSRQGRRRGHRAPSRAISPSRRWH